MKKLDLTDNEKRLAASFFCGGMYSDLIHHEANPVYVSMCKKIFYFISQDMSVEDLEQVKKQVIEALDVFDSRPDLLHKIENSFSDLQDYLENEAEEEI